MRQFPRLTFAAMLMAAALALSAIAHAAPSAEKATSFIDNLSDRVLAIVRDTSLDKGVREQRIRDIMAGNVALESIARFALGDLQKEATPQQLADYQQAFADYLLLTYSRLLSAYGGQTFKIDGTKPLDDKDIFVNSQITGKDGQKTRAVWRVRAGGGELVIVDVVIDGASLAVTQKSEIASVARNGGIDSVIEALRKRNSG